MPYTPQDLKGREHRCVVVFCSQGDCTATKLSFVGHVWGARKEFREAGWGSGRSLGCSGNRTTHSYVRRTHRTDCQITAVRAPRRSRPEGATLA